MRHYAKLDNVYLYGVSSKTGLKVKKKQILWGDYLNVIGEVDSHWVKVRWGKETYFVKRKHITRERPLEVIFLDVGQGDSCIFTSAVDGQDERIMVIDAGAGANTYRYLEWRFGKFKKRFRFHAAVITHPDSDHYKGFQKLFDESKVSFEHVYHNGIAERPGDDKLGPSDPSGRYLTDVIVNNDQMTELYRTKARRKRLPYPKLLHTAVKSGRVGSVDMISTTHGAIEVHDGRAYLPGFGPSDDTTIEVLGPVPEPDPSTGAPRLRWFGKKPDSNDRNEGKTKNGHSIILKLSYGPFSLLFGGDLNKSAETYLLRHYGNNGRRPTTTAAVARMVEKARKRFHVDMMKACHHGSTDVTDEFLEAVNALAFVVSSGDEESHVHPRPDLLGRLGKKGRGDSPLLLCTELLRSTRELESKDLERKLNQTTEKLDVALQKNQDQLPQDEVEELRNEIRELKEARTEINRQLLRRNVGVYGAITLRTDGEDVLIAFMREKPQGKKRWQTYHYRNGPSGFDFVDES